MQRDRATLLRSFVVVVAGLAMVGASLAASGVARASRTSNQARGTVNSSFCNSLGVTRQASAGARMACFGPQPNGPGAAASSKSSFTGSNVNAANPSEDVVNGTRAYGQSEESVASSGQYVVEAWNDSTGFFAPNCSSSYKDQGTGFAFSSNGGKTFTDEGGLPNTNCFTGSRYSGDPSVEVWSPAGHTYFYISSLITGGDCNGLCIAITTCQAVGTSISCNLTPTELQDYPGSFNIMDKDFMSIDPVRGSLYISFTNFIAGNQNGQIELWGCNIHTAPGSPACNGPSVIDTATDCAELEGAYPAVNLNNGDVYVAYEFNWATNLFGCTTDPVAERLRVVSGTCENAGYVGCTPYSSTSIPITSMDAAFVAGYNRFPANDFPRIAVSDPFGTVSLVWNDAGNHVLGDILLESWSLGALVPVQATPVRINSSTGGLHFLPALRNVDDDGDLQISFYQRANGNTAMTSVFAAIDVKPTTTSTPSSTLVTSVASNWLTSTSDIIPNYGDYTDNYVQAKNTAPYTTQGLFIAWADSRIGVPQPFSAHKTTN